MGEHLAETLLKTADVLHWIGRYAECNALVLLSRLLRLRDLDTLDKLRAFVEGEEAAHFARATPSESATDETKGDDRA